jgi:glycine oxidase
VPVLHSPYTVLLSPYNRRVETGDVVIAGAGIIGLSLALELASHRLRVVVLERGVAMSESSWAAAGMLAANDPANPPELRELSQLSLHLYPGFLAKIERLSGRRVPIRTQATLQAIHNRESPKEPTPHVSSRPERCEVENSAVSFRFPHAIPSFLLTQTELRKLVPHINPDSGPFQRLEEQSLDPRDLCLTLPLAAKAAGVVLRESSPVISIDIAPGQIIIQTPTTPIAARHFVNCAGAWAGFPSLAHMPARPLDITPRKGQIATLRLPTSETLNCVLRTPEIYLVPRGDGRVVIGATLERSGFDKSVEPAAIVRLLAAAAHLWPPIAHAEVIESWAGLRPATENQLPVIGRIEPNHWIATGHFRNGILLAPATARLLAQTILGQSPEIDLSAFDPAQPAQQIPAELPVLSPV